MSSKNKTTQEVIDFLEIICEMCDTKATKMVKSTEHNIEDGVDVIIKSGLIMNVHVHTKMIISKLEEDKGIRERK